MPTYEYECNQCKFHFELLQNINEPPAERCPKCGGKVRRLISGGAGLIFKGSGFYITDYKKNDAPGDKKESGLKKPDGKQLADHKKE